MLPITLESPQQINLFPTQQNHTVSYEIEVVNNGPNAEIRLSFLTRQKVKAVRRTRKKSLPKFETILLFQ
jgi:hypothetical protein